MNQNKNVDKCPDNISIIWGENNQELEKLMHEINGTEQQIKFRDDLGWL